MHEIAPAHSPNTADLKQSLWQCHRCAAIIAIYSIESIECAICPICCDVTLDQRGSFESILGMTFQERPPDPS
jgi:Zn-finger nucleic acid-binding protein